jgi:cupin 2 domain-containing protein
MQNIYDAIPGDLKSEVFDLLLDSEIVKIERIVSKGHKSPAAGWYDQDSNEWILLLKGAAILSFDDKTSITLKAGDFYNIPAHKKHRVEWTDPGIESIWLAIHY